MFFCDHTLCLVRPDIRLPLRSDSCLVYKLTGPDSQEVWTLYFMSLAKVLIWFRHKSKNQPEVQYTAWDPLVSRFCKCRSICSCVAPNIPAPVIGTQSSTRESEKLWDTYSLAGYQKLKCLSPRESLRD